MLSNNLPKYFVIFVIVFIILVSIPITLYIINVGDGFSSISKNWGDFGSYLSGTVSSIISPLSLLAVTYTLALQIKDNRSNSYLRRRESYLDSINLIIERERENITINEMQYDGNEKIQKIDSLYRKAFETNDSDEIEELRTLINSFKHHVELKEAKVNYLGKVDELHLIKNEIYLLKNENITELEEVYLKGVGKYFTK